MALFFEYPEQVIYIRKGKTLAGQEAAEESAGYNSGSIKK